MTELLKFLSTNSPAALAFGVAVLILAVTVSVICVVAFIQGRSISFWPPSIGERPKAHALLEGKAEQDEEPFESRTSPPGSSSPVVSRNTTLQGASGITYRVTSGFYGGANATLYKADDQKGAAVIAKVYWRGLAPNSPPWELFQQEQRTAEILNHRNIVKTLDRGLRMGYPFTIIEYLGGGTLRDWLRVHDRLPGRDIASIASQLADAIDYAHSRRCHSSGHQARQRSLRIGSKRARCIERFWHRGDPGRRRTRHYGCWWRVQRIAGLLGA